jgi:AAA domain (dynein-related subfamily)
MSKAVGKSKSTPAGATGAAMPAGAASDGNGAVTVLRRHAEEQFAEELAALARVDDRHRPPRWRLSPWAVSTYLLGGKLDGGFVVAPKYIGSRRLVEIAVSTLATDRALLLLGVPGTAKSWVSEHLAAAISGDSTRLVQGTAGTSEEAIRYGWSYALLPFKGPSMEAPVAGPLMRAMQDGRIARIAELTRIPAGPVRGELEVFWPPPPPRIALYG